MTVFLLFALLILPTAVFGQALPNPDKVAPEYRDYAARRRAELIRQQACQGKANNEKVATRDRASYVLRCMEAAEKAQQNEIGQAAKK
jgi:hypothetical protein